MEERKSTTKKLAGATTTGASALKSTLQTASSSTKPASGRFASALPGAAAAADTKTPIKEVKDGESSGYSDFDEEEIE